MRNQPSPDRLGGGLGPVVVALHDVVAADRDLAELVRRPSAVVPVVVDQLHLDAPDRQADRAGPRTRRPRSLKVATGDVSDRP